MRALLIASLQPRSGRTAIAAALVQRLAFEGRRVVGVRLGGTGDSAATADAGYFATLPGARGRGGLPLPLDGAEASVAQLAEDGFAVIEAPAGAGANAPASTLDAAVIVVHRGVPNEDATLQLQNMALDLGPRFLGLVITAVPQGFMLAAESAMDEAALPLIVAIPEDRVLYSPTIGELADTLKAEMLLGDEAEDQVIEELMIGPITTDSSNAYFSRRGHKAVITRSDKTDLQLAALATDTDCLILTGGISPSPYTLDRASSEEVAVMLTPSDTRATVDSLAGIFQQSRFGSERKLERITELLKDRVDWSVVDAALK
jgi:BioD-like phosphotransacetylase family protein